MIGCKTPRRVGIAALAALVLLVVPASALAAGTAPAVVGAIQSSTSLSGVIGVAVAGNYAYTTAYWPGQLTVVDISNPASPQIVASTTTMATALKNGSSVTISGPYAFVVSKNRNASTSSNDDGSGNSLTIVDISTPTSPTVLGTVHSSTQLFGAYGVAVKGNYAFVAYQGLLGSPQPQSPDTSTGGFSVINITNPAGPTIVANIDNNSLTGGQLNDLWHATSVAISGNYAYVTAFNSGHLTVIDITTPTSPQIVYTLADWNHLQDADYIAISGGYAYIAGQTGAGSSQPNYELIVVSLANPTRPAIVGALTNNTLLTGAYRLRVRGNWVYIAAHNRATVAAIDVSNPAAPRLAGYVTDAGHLAGTTDVDVDATGRYLVANSPLLNTETYPLYPPFPGSGGPTNTGTISVIDLIPNPIAVPIAPASEPANPTVSTTASFQFAASDDVSTVACSRDGAPLSPCTTQTTQTYSGLAVGNHTFTVQATDAAGHTASSSYSWTIGTAPVVGTPGPSISGTPASGQTLTASPGTWAGSPAPSFTYQWVRCDQNAQNCAAFGTPSTSNTYDVVPSDTGSTFEVTVTATNSVGSAQATSGPTAVVQGTGVAPSNTAAPSVSSSTPTVGQVLTASPGSWSGSPSSFTYSYQWQRCAGASCVSVATNSATYTVTAADAGSSLQVVVTASNGVLPDGHATSPATQPVTQAPAGGAPSISGTTTQGQTLSASPGTWSGYPSSFTYAYQWQRCDSSGANCTNIGTGVASYALQRADVGNTIRVQVTASNGVAPAGTATSPTTARIAGPPVNVTLPTVSGTDVQGSVLTATAGTWSGYPAPVYSYEWQRCPTSGEGCTLLSTARSTTYTLTAADVGYAMRILVQAQNSAGSGVPARSAGTPVIQSSTSASVKGLLGARPSLVMRSRTPGHQITRLVASLGGGLGFAKSAKALSRAITVTDGSGHRVGFTAKLVHGSLVLTLTRGVSTLRVTVAGAALVVTHNLSRTTRNNGSHLTLTVVLSETGNRSARDRIQLPVH